MTDYNKILKEILFIKQSILSIDQCGVRLGEWVPKKTVMKFLDYGDTQMRALERSNSLEVTKIGHRKFYSIKSILELLNKNKLNTLSI